MSEEIEAIKYLMTNIEIHRRLLKQLCKNKETKNNIYVYIKYQMREYARFNISLRRMLESRTKRTNGTKSAMLDIASSITNRKSKMEKIDDYIEFFKESAKVNIMDLKRIRENYKIKSKNVQKLIDRLEEFEEKNLNNVLVFINNKWNTKNSNFLIFYV